MRDGNAESLVATEYIDSAGKHFAPIQLNLQPYRGNYRCQ